jgi:hypothetical protein
MTMSTGVSRCHRMSWPRRYECWATRVSVEETVRRSVFRHAFHVRLMLGERDHRNSDFASASMSGGKTLRDKR